MRHWPFVFLGWLCVTAPFAVMALSGEVQEAPAAAGAPRTDGELARLERRVAELEAANADLERLLTRYRSGLEEAVAELNRVGGRRTPAAPSPPAGSSLRGRSTLETGNRLLSRPRTTVAGGRAVVKGEVKNTRPETVDGTLVIELLCDGALVDEARLPFAVPPYGAAPYSRTFELEGWAAGHYTARVGLVF